MNQENYLFLAYNLVKLASFLQKLGQIDSRYELCAETDVEFKS